MDTCKQGTAGEDGNAFQIIINNQVVRRLLADKDCFWENFSHLFGCQSCLGHKEKRAVCREMCGVFLMRTFTLPPCNVHFPTMHKGSQ